MVAPTLTRNALINRAHVSARLSETLGAVSVSDRFFHACCEMYRFGLSDEQAWQACQYWNARKTSLTPGADDAVPWSDEEIEHKLHDARQRVEEEGQFGDRWNPNDMAVVMESPQLCETLRSLTEVLAKQSDLYVKSGMLVEHSRNEEGHPTLHDLSLERLHIRLSEHVRYMKPGPSGPSPTMINERVLKALHRAERWEGVRPVKGLIAWPVLHTDGTVCTEVGYDEESQYIYDPTHPVDIELPETFGLDDAQAALAELLEPVEQFPFESEADRSAWVALILSVLAVPVLEGNTPFFLVNANTRGSGKGLLLNVAYRILTGRDVPTDNSCEGEEMRKKITALLLETHPLIVFDNVVSGKSFGSAELDRLLTTRVWSDRRLGHTQILRLENRTVWAATGNNITINPGSDMDRRLINIQLTSPLEKPEEREDLKHTDLLQYVTDNRARLMACCYRILVGFLQTPEKDRPAIKPFSSFEAWSHLVRRACVWVGLEDPRDTVTQMQQRGDSGDAMLQQLVAYLGELCKKETCFLRGISARALVDWAFEKNALGKFSTDQPRMDARDVLSAVMSTLGSHDSMVQTLGSKMKELRDRWFSQREGGQMRLVQDRRCNTGMRYKVETR